MMPRTLFGSMGFGGFASHMQPHAAGFGLIGGEHVPQAVQGHVPAAEASVQPAGGAAFAQAAAAAAGAAASAAAEAAVAAAARALAPKQQKEPALPQRPYPALSHFASLQQVGLNVPSLLDCCRLPLQQLQQ